ncbi:hypothetical protein JOE44_002468 [Chryseobacterium sp. PvR013]|uniref:hypothetical protein n=1 Tax=Chryseobacterium sp. PvR013 TaxID=2806595 RepID=UPI001AE3E7B7|nr:hypothetical protein [Chryseobacterium sp. PvR013]MBP1165584.1 hypothetical protein [Chryseobacterium sp. PvR013]
MKNFFLLFIFLLLSNSVEAHKPKVRIENFGNIKTYFKSGFNFNQKTIESEELKIQVIGRLSRIIAEKLRCSDTIMIERTTYYAHNPTQSFFILENNNSHYKLAVLDQGVLLKTNNSGLAIRVLSENVNVVDVLKLVEYSILNRKKINKKLITKSYFYGEEKLMILANSEDFIRKICKMQSKLVDEVINNNIELLDNGFLRTKISWKNGKFMFGINRKYPTGETYSDFVMYNYEIEDFKYYVDSAYSDFFVIFLTPNTFTYFDGDNNNTPDKIEVEKSSWYPFQLSRDNFGDKIVLFDTNTYFYVYNFKKKLLQRIE